LRPAAPVPAPVTKNARPVSSASPTVPAAFVSTAEAALDTELGLVASIVSAVVNILVPPETLVGIAVPEATERISTVILPELLGVYTYPRTPSINHGYGILNHAAGVVLTEIAPVSALNTITAVIGNPFTNEVVVVIEDTLGVKFTKFRIPPRIVVVVCPSVPINTELLDKAVVPIDERLAIFALVVVKSVLRVTVFDVVVFRFD
jgi:hypothetical protein